MQNETGVVLPWEKYAIEGSEMPDGLGYPDQTLFLQLRLLYHQYRAGIIEREVAVREKRKLLITYNGQKFAEKMGKYWVEQIKKTELAKAEYRKNRTIENADKLLLAIDGVK